MCVLFRNPITLFTLTSLFALNPPIYNEDKYEAGIVTNGHVCAEIGSRMLIQGGSAVDAAIAAMLCEGITMPQSMGIGGGFVMTIYTRSTRSVTTLDAREVAPLGATRDMFKGNSTLAKEGGLSIAVPGEIRGYWEAHQKLGKLPWFQLFQPNIDLCRNGFLITSYLEKVLKIEEKKIRQDRGLRQIYINPQTNVLRKKGDLIRQPKLARTLKEIAKDGSRALYDGTLTKKFVRDIQKAGGIITEADMKAYKPIWNKPITANLADNKTLYTTSLPSSGIILSFVLNILNGFLDRTNLNTITNWQRIVESFKHGYAKRTHLGDPMFLNSTTQKIDCDIESPTCADQIRSTISDNTTSDDPKHYGAADPFPEDHGTAHISVIAPNGDAVAVTSTINHFFGSGFLSTSTGIVLNNQMSDFSIPKVNISGIPPFAANLIAPGKRPMSSMCPAIVVDENGDAILVIGAAGGVKIITVVTLGILRYLWFNEEIDDAVRNHRLHHQVFPMKIMYEKGFDKNILVGLSKIGHKTKEIYSPTGFAAVTALIRKNGIVSGAFDRRRQGQVCLLAKMEDGYYRQCKYYA